MGDEGDKLASSDVIQQFEQANPNIKVNVTAIPWNVAHDKLITAVAGKQTPDVTQLGTTWAGEFSKLNARMLPKACSRPRPVPTNPDGR